MLFRSEPFEAVAARIERDGLDEEHLAGLGLFGDPEVDANGDPVIPRWDLVLPVMAVDCLDQLQKLKLVDGDHRVTPAGRRCMKDHRELSQAIRQHYTIEGKDGVRRSVAAELKGVFRAFTKIGIEREEDPFSVIYRPALCLAEFMRLHFWMQDERETGSGVRTFAEMLVKERREDLQGMEVEDDDIEWAAYCAASGAGRRIEALYGERAEATIAAVKSTALMLCDAGYLGMDGFPGELQWLVPADDRFTGRKQAS